MYSLGQKIKELRINAHLTQMDLADMLNMGHGTSVSKSMISKWENDLEEPSLANGRNLARYFNLSLDELLGLSLDVEFQTPAPPQDEESWSAEEIEEIERFKTMIIINRKMKK